MKCKLHPSDSAAGVCACCLRERLHSLASSTVGEHPVPPPLIRQKSNPSSAPSRLLRPRSAVHSAAGVTSHQEEHTAGGGGGRRISVLSPGLGHPSPIKRESKLSRPNSWFSSLIRGGRKRPKNASPQISSAPEETGHGGLTKAQILAANCRGMSPAAEEETEYYASDGEYATARRLPGPSPLMRKATAAQQNNANHSPRSVSSFALCITPLIRTSPGNRRSFATPESPRGVFTRRCGGGALPDGSFILQQNRSRKLVDLGKVW
ncbi:hypothetical protein HPP92_027072 [Vanilla planifolia]|uniref:Uncharacterized protein n=1 Tax=Vanilla planifolia TaxID=51239 RepID=A0A835PA45_VANPL|nr:hypothetical protein HPP92_027072 [Vanilla planifolia]